MALEVAAWNVKEGLAQAEQAPAIVERIKRMGAAVVALSDAYSLDNPLHGSDGEILERSRDSLKAEGYLLYETEYGDNWHHDRNIMMLSRLPFNVAHTVRLGPRRAIGLRTVDLESQEPVDVFAVHFPDANERNRKWMARQVVQRVDPAVPTIVMGDFNTMHPADVVARIMHNKLLRAGIERLPGGRKKDVASRFAEMASGYAISYLHNNGLKDADSLHGHTFPSRYPVAQLDRMLVSSAVGVERFKIEPHCGASDHRAIRANLYIR